VVTGGTQQAAIRAGLRVLLIAAGVLAIEPTALGQPSVPKEYQVKAAFLFHFVQFVEWPPSAFASADAPICIGVLGENPFGNALGEVVRGEKGQNRNLIVQPAQRAEDLRDCHLVFISKSETPRMASILAELDTRPVLTVSEIDGLAQRGAVINLYLAGSKVRFEISPMAARRKGLKISSQLLSLGRIVDGDRGGEKR
jgi:hypothetical protein